MESTPDTIVVCSFAISNRINLIFEKNERDICTEKDAKIGEDKNNNIETCTEIS